MQKTETSSAITGAKPTSTLAGIAGWGAVFLALAVLIGWVIQSPLLVQVDPRLVPMQPNTALGFLALGLGLLALRHGRTLGARVLAGLALAFGTLTIVEYLSGLALGIDLMLGEPFTAVNTAIPGRMAMNTAICLSISALGILYLSLEQVRISPVLGVGVGGLLVAALGASRLVGHMVGIEQSYDWGNVTRMAVHTASGFVLVGLGLAGAARATLRAKNDQPLPVNVMLIGFGTVFFSAVLMMLVERWDARLREARFHADAESQTDAVGRVFHDFEDELLSVRGLYVASRSVEADEFRAFCASLLARSPQIQTLAWAPRVTDAGRTEHEAAVAAERVGYRVCDPAFKAGALEADRVASAAPAPRRDVYFPLLFVEPRSPAEDRYGLDIAVLPEVRAAVEAACDSGQPVCVPPPAAPAAAAAGEPSPDPEITVVCPVYRNGVPAGTLEERRAAFAGVLLGMGKVAGMLEEALGAASRSELIYWLYDAAEPEQARLITARSGNGEGCPLPAPPLAGAGGHAAAMLHCQTLPFASREWLLCSTPTPTYLATHRSWQPLAILLVGAAFSILLVGHQHGNYRLTVRAERQVKERTLQLKLANDSLQRENRERQAAEQAARAGERRLALVVETAHDAYIAIDESGCVVDWNPQAARMFGWRREEALGRVVADLILPERDRPRHRAGMERYLRTGEGPLLDRLVEVMGLHRSGREFPLDMSISTVRSESGSLFHAFLRDITERKRATAELHQAKEAAEAASRAKGEFLANMSHEIRTPMSAIIGMTHLLMETSLSPEQRRDLSVVRTSAESLLGVINEILDYSRIEAGRMGLESVEFEIRETLEDATRALQVSAQEKGLRLNWHGNEDLPGLAVGDPLRLRQILLNLVGNAIKFTDRGSVFVRAQREPAAAGKVGIRVLVIDSGIGIPRDKQEEIFEPFMQVDTSASRRFGGTGLGLPISRRLVEQMGGRMWVESEVGRGSTFAFTAFFPEVGSSPGATPAATASSSAPVARAAAPPAVAVARPQTAEGAAAAGGPATEGQATPLASRHPGISVLLAEDNDVNRELAMCVLKRVGHRVTWVASGGAAVAATSRERFDIVLMDVQMPEINGIEATRAIREGERGSGRHLPIIALTAHAMRGDREACMEAGMDDYLSKPFLPRALIAPMDRVLEEWGGGAGRPAESGATGPANAAVLSVIPDSPVGAGWDRSAALRLCAGDVALLRRLAQQALADLEPALARLRAAADGGDDVGLARAAHSLKGAAGQLAATAVQAAARRVEECAGAGALAEARTALAGLEAAARDLTSALVAELKEVGNEGSGSG
ncbi:MAG: CHASE domain-containing protein [Planctomycetes bacterium]|nr:CHASE domain-containing protein [Planctomycetota bacterium]